jgi:hypothetical protein
VDTGWVKLHRKFLAWEWYDTPHMVHVFVHLLLNVNHEEKTWRGVSVKPGQVITGLHKLSQCTGISVRSIRTCLERLKLTNEIAIKSTNKFSIIMIINWDSYQVDKKKNDTHNDKPSDKRRASNRQAIDNNQEVKELKNEENNTTEVSGGVTDELPDPFVRFWSAYPKKMGKQEALKAWVKINPKNGLVEKMLSALEVQRKWPDWNKAGGQYIPRPSTWLNQKRWEDEITVDGQSAEETYMDKKLKEIGYAGGAETR